MADWLRPFQPRLPLPALVEQVNNLYHACEADSYDARHVEIMEQLPKHWRRMIRVALDNGPARPWRILDFGCGTGFASMQLFDCLPREEVAELICYDPSAHMLNQCREKLAGRNPRIRFIDNFEDLFEVGPIHVLATNSVLHHLPDPFGSIELLEKVLGRDGVWLAGHEPSCRFYRNLECTRLYRNFLREEKVRRFFRPSNWWRRLADLFTRRHSPARQGARLAFQRGLFGVQPSPRVISRLVDFHVPRENDPSGFCLDFLRQHLSPRWRQLWQTSYAFLGRAYEGQVPSKWCDRARELSERFPLDGANFCSVWKWTDSAESATSAIEQSEGLAKP
jgi:ubiquinone/menaquinone biosynthesis C-methylase UbiE